MRNTTFESRLTTATRSPAGWRWWMKGALEVALGVALGVAAVGCGPAEPLSPETQEPAQARQAMTVSNGLNLNGLNHNGLNLNGLSLNGLNLNGLGTQDFTSWFRADVATRAEVMDYIVQCAVPAGQTRSYTFPDTGTTYQWNGVLGLAPGWSSGNAASTVELQVVSACMAAHANKFGLHVSISVRGVDGAGVTIATTSAEVSNYTLREACFFGNLFDGTGVFGGNDGLTLSAQQSSPRVCGLPGTQCSPMAYVGSCSTYCTADATGSHYTSCTYGGVTYRPIAVRMQPSDIATCGNGKCELSETCSASSSLTRCTADCGTCS